MSRLRRLAPYLFAIFAIAFGAGVTGARAQMGDKTEVRTEQVRARLLAHAPQGVPLGLAPEAAARQPVWLGLQISHAPDWHTYWKNAGDSGMPTELHWALPPGVSVKQTEAPSSAVLTTWRKAPNSSRP